VLGKKEKEMSDQSIVLLEEDINEEYRKIVAKANPDGSLLIDGVDMGPICEKYWGDFDYEYSLTIPGPYVPKLVSVMSKYGSSDASDPLEASMLLLQAGFAEDLTFSGVAKLCEENGIESKFWSWT
jgi:hypothetical protein